MFALKRLSIEAMDEAAVIHRTAFDERLPWLVGLHTPEQDRAYFRNRVFANCEVWGALEGSLIGFIAFREDWIDQFYVLPQQQRRGAGRALLQVAMTTFPILMLWTFQKNASSRRFYESNGFLVVRETDGSGNAEREPDVLYRWARPN
jgi:putative acetyltransferase